MNGTSIETFDSSFLTYERKPEVGRKVVEEIIETLGKGQPPAQQEEIRTNLGQRDLFAEYRALYSPLGLQDQDVVHAYAAYLATMLAVLDGSGGQLSRSHVHRAVAALGSITQPRVLNDRDLLQNRGNRRQLVGDGLACEAVLANQIHNEVLLSGQAAVMQQLQQSARQNLRKRGMNGLVRRAPKSAAVKAEHA